MTEEMIILPLSAQKLALKWEMNNIVTYCGNTVEENIKGLEWMEESFAEAEDYELAEVVRDFREAYIAVQ